MGRKNGMSLRSRHPKFGSPGVLLLALALSCGAAPAEPMDDPTAEAGSTDAATHQMVEATRNMARAFAEWLARGVDSWFGDKPFEDGGRVTDGRLSLAVFKMCIRDRTHVLSACILRKVPSPEGGRLAWPCLLYTSRCV